MTSASIFNSGSPWNINHRHNLLYAYFRWAALFLSLSRGHGKTSAVLSIIRMGPETGAHTSPVTCDRRPPSIRQNHAEYQSNLQRYHPPGQTARTTTKIAAQTCQGPGETAAKTKRRDEHQVWWIAFVRLIGDKGYLFAGSVSISV